MSGADERAAEAVECTAWLVCPPSISFVTISSADEEPDDCEHEEDYRYGDRNADADTGLGVDACDLALVGLRGRGGRRGRRSRRS